MDQNDQNTIDEEESEDDMVDVNDIKSYEAPGLLLSKSRETLGSNSSAKMYDNVPKTNDSGSLFQGDEEAANTDSDGKRCCLYRV